VASFCSTLTVEEALLGLYGLGCLEQRSLQVLEGKDERILRGFHGLIPNADLAEIFGQMAVQLGFFS
jgi:hypothetical protein